MFCIGLWERNVSPSVLCRTALNISLSPFNYSSELKGLGADFVFGFVQSMDGERDPRNLLLAFQIAKNIIHRGYDMGEHTHIYMHKCIMISFSPFSFDDFRSHNFQSGRIWSISLCLHFNFLAASASPGKFTEELFEVTSCYFPIDFSPVSPCLLSCLELKADITCIADSYVITGFLCA